MFGISFDNVGENYYDVQRTDGAAIRSVITGKLTEKSVITQP